MMEALLKELDLRKNELDKDRTPSAEIQTIYFGGGTPSLLPVMTIERLLKKVREQYAVSARAEITLEANPDDITPAKAAHWREIGINRLSIGIQSFREEDLIWMNRAHNSNQAIDCIHYARDAGFDNFSIDLIFGVPGMSDAHWRSNVETAVALNVPHIAAYALTVEPKTALDKLIALGKKEAVNDSAQAGQFLQLMEFLQQAGYEHYEISNFARPGYRSAHNSSYWQHKPYLGIGPGAHSFDGERRSWNIANNALYIRSIDEGKLPSESEQLTPEQQLNEYIMISLRTIAGIDLNRVSNLFGELEKHELLLRARPDLGHENLLLQGHRLVLTQKGKVLADGISVRLFR